MKITNLELNNFNSEKFRYFHPSLTCLQDNRIMAVMQTINAGDYYGEPEFAITADGGKTWTEPQKIPAFRHKRLSDSPFVQAVADVRCFTMQDGSVAAFGCTTFYTSQGCASWDKSIDIAPPPGRAVYAVWSPESGTWSNGGILPLPGIERSYRTSCTQAVLLENNKIILPVYFDTGIPVDHFGYKASRFASLTAIYGQNGSKFEFIAQSNQLEIRNNRGCIEPSAVRLPDGSYAMTMRAEDGNMYYSVSKDALNWSEPAPWVWDDNTAIKTASTQQHWVRIGDKVFLVYTRSDGSNDHLMRYRAPLYIAEVNTTSGQLLRTTEQVVFKRKCRDEAEALYGNFHCAQFNANCAVITDAALFHIQKQTSTEVMAAMITAD